MIVRILTQDERRQGLGATDVAAIVGVAQYRTPIETFLEKTGQAPPQEQTWRMRLGQLFEDAIADAYAESTGRKLARTGVAVHKRYPYLYAHPDRKVIGEPGLVEIKKTRWAFGEEPPVGYRVQAQFQMALTGRLWCDIASFSGDDIAVHRVERDQELIDSLIEAAVAFWTDNVQAGIPPEVDGTDAYRRYLASRQEPVEEERTATAEQVLLIDELQALGEQAKAIDARQSLIKNRLAEHMGSATRLVAPQASVTYRMTKASEYVVKREAARVLRVNFKREG